MTADQQAADALDREWQHALAALPPRPCLSDHGAVLKHRRCEQQLQELLSFYSRKLPVHLYGPRLLSAGAELQGRHDYRLAAELCFQRLAKQNLPSAADSCRKLDAAGRLGLHVQALYGLHVCQAAEALLLDASLQHHHTAAVLSALAGLQAACQLVLPGQPLLVHAGTQHISEVASRLRAAGMHTQALPYLLFAARAMECHISLSSTTHLPWRVQLYSAVAECYCVQLSRAAAAASGHSQGRDDAGAAAPDSAAASALAAAADEAMAVLASGLAQLETIASAQSLDAVPAPEVIAGIQAAQAQLVLLQSLFQQHSSAAGAGNEQRAAEGQLLSSLVPVGSSKLQLAALVGLLQAGLAHHQCPVQKQKLPAALQPAMAAAAELAGQALGGAAAAEAEQADADALDCRLYMELLLVAYQYQQQELLQKLLAAFLQAPPAVAPGPPAAAASPPGLTPDKCLAATAAVLEAVDKLQGARGPSAMQHMAAVLAQHSAALGSCAPKLLSAAADELLAAADPTLQGCFGPADSNSDLVQAVLQGLHAALQHSGHPDGVLRGSVALRLAALLEAQGQLDHGLLVVKEGLAAVVAARCGALTHLQGQADDHVRWISGSRTQPDLASAALLAGMSDAEQVLACLHADALMLNSRLQLKHGLSEAAAKTAARQQRLQATLQKRDQQADIFGARTQKEQRLDTLRVENAGQPPITALDVEQRLLAECGACPYQRALALTATALMQPDVNRQAALLEEACDALQAAHAAEAELFASQQPAADALRPTSAQHIRPANPRILCRTPNSISLAAFPVKVSRDGRRPAAFAAYSKPCAAGVSLTINKTAAELPGTGVQMPLDGRITIEGLQSNQAYNFAVAVFDDQGILMGELGASSPSIVMSLPLPVYYCYAQVLLAAAQLGLRTVAKTAGGELFHHFFTTTPARPIWQAHPADRHTLQVEQVAMCPAPFLRLLVQAVFAYAGHLGAKQLATLTEEADGSSGGSDEAAASGSGLAGTAASRALLLPLSKGRLHTQVALLEVAQRHLLAMQVAAQAGDEMLVEEGALRTYRLLTPLLQQQDISPALFQPLSELHRLLAAVRDTAPRSVSGHEQQRQQAAQVLVAASFWKLRLLEPVGADAAAGSAAVALHGVAGLQLKPSALTALDGALLRVLSGSSHAPDAAAAGQDSGAALKTTKAGSKKAQGGHKGGQKAASGTDAAAAAAASASPAAAGSSTEQAKELGALHELLLWHPSGVAWAADLHASRCGDPSDLVAQVLPKLEQPHALTTCWPLLSAPAAQAHPRWLPLCVLLMQAAAKQHGAALWLSLPPADKARGSAGSFPVGVSLDSLPEAARLAPCAQLTAAAAAASELLQAVKQAVRMAARRPDFLNWPREPRSTVESGAAALEAEGFALGSQGTAAPVPQPEHPAGATAAAKAAAAAAWQQQNAELLAQERRRLAAALLLQQRLPVLLGRKQAIAAARLQLSAWGPWLAQLHSIVGSLAAEAAAQLLAQAGPSVTKPPAAAAEVPGVQAVDSSSADALTAAAGSGGTAVDAAAAEGGAAGASTARPTPEPVSKPASPRKPGPEGSRPQTAPQDGAAAGAKPNTVADVASTLALQAHQQFAQAATLCARGGDHQQLSAICKQLQGISAYLLNRLPALLGPVPAVKWSIRPLPEPAVPALLATAPERCLPDALAGTGSGKGAAADKKGAASTAGGKGASAADKKAVPGRAGRGAGTPRADAKHTLLPESRSPHVGTSLRVIVEAVLAAVQQCRSSLGQAPDSKTVASTGGPSTARSFATSFSFGSDAVGECWHTGSGVDVAGLTQVVALVLRALHELERWRCMLDLGGAWLVLCQGTAYAAAVVPLLMTAARKAGSVAYIAALLEADKALTADKNAALDDLATVRLLVQERLQGLPPLDAALSGSSNSGSSTDPQLPKQASALTRSATPDQVLLPAEYERVIAQLKKRGEKGHMILALNELGDVHAHFGGWPQAGEAWSSALDALLGPYHVVDTWRHKLQLGSGEELLRRYGVHGLLLAAVVLGKLARYTYSGDLGSRLSCALLAVELLPAVFAGDMIHPQRRLDFAAYVPVELWPGMDVFDDPHRCNAAALASSLECLVSALHEQQLHLLSLPLLSLWEHVSLHVARNRASTVLARITRVRALAALGLMPQAAAVLQVLMQGTNLPGLVLGPPQPVLGAAGIAVGLAPGAAFSKAGGKTHAAAEGKDGRDAAVAWPEVTGGDDARPRLYHADKWPGDPANAGFLQHVAEAVLEPAVTAAYGLWLCGHLTLARATFLAAAGGVVDCWATGKPAALADLVRVGPPPLPSPGDATAAAGMLGAGSDAAAPPVPSPRSTSAAKGAKTTAAGASAAAAGKAADAKAAAGPGAAASSAAPPPARALVEFKLLAAAAQLLQSAVSASCAASGMSASELGIPWTSSGAAEVNLKPAVGKAATGRDKPGGHGSTAKAGQATAKGAKGTQRHGKGGHAVTKGSAGQQQTLEQAEGAEAAAAERRAAAAAEVAAAQHQQLLVQALLQLAAVQSARWLPLQALPVCLAACEALKHAASAADGCGLAWSDSPLDGSHAETKASLQPSSSTWLAARWQLAQVLLQLHHYGPCTAVCIKAQTDAARAADVTWSARLLGVQAAAAAAQGDRLSALNCYRAALARLEEHSMPDSLVLPLQLDYASLCEEVGARGDFDRLSGTSLAASTAEIQELGLLEMLEHAQLTNVYLPAAAAHLAALLKAASAATRRRQLATADRHLRAAADMLACCRCHPMHAAAVLTARARVLRLQAALKLPDTPLLAPSARPQAAAAGAGCSDASSRKSSDSGGGAAVPLQQRRLHEAAHLLKAALQVLVVDGGSNPVLVRAALLELAAVLIQAAGTQADGDGSLAAAAAAVTDATAAAKTAAVLRAAHVTAGHVCKLLLDSHSLQPVQGASSCLPDWLQELLNGHEQLQLSLQQQAATAAAAVAAGGAGSKAASSSSSSAAEAAAGGSTMADLPAVSDAALGRLAVCFYVQQLLAMSDSAAGRQQQQLAAEQAVLLQPVLRAACAKFAAECCWPEVPPEVAAVLQSLSAPQAQPALPAPPAGTVLVQWHRQDGCWQVPSSWACHGTLPASGQLSSEALGSLPKQQPCISCLYVVAVPAGAGGAAAGMGRVGPMLLQGELIVSLERAKRVQLQVKAMRRRLESPGRPTDILAQPAPSTAELAATKHSLECLLAAVPQDDMPPPPADLPPAAAAEELPAQGSAAGGAPQTAAAGAGGKGGTPTAAAPAPGAAAAKPAVPGKASATGGAAPAPGKAAAAPGAAAGSVTPDADAAVAQLEWRLLETWCRVEALMDLEGGLSVTDAAVAGWLAGVLQRAAGGGGAGVEG